MTFEEMSKLTKRTVAALLLSKCVSVESIKFRLYGVIRSLTKNYLLEGDLIVRRAL